MNSNFLLFNSRGGGIPEKDVSWKTLFQNIPENTFLAV